MRKITSTRKSPVRILHSHPAFCNPEKSLEIAPSRLRAGATSHKYNLFNGMLAGWHTILLLGVGLAWPLISQKNDLRPIRQPALKVQFLHRQRECLG